MKNDELKKMLKDIKVPAPDDKKKEEGIRAAMEAFDAAQKEQKTSKGNVLEERPKIVKNIFGGIPVMRALGTVAVIAVVFAVALALITPQFSAYRKRGNVNTSVRGEKPNIVALYKQERVLFEDSKEQKIGYYKDEGRDRFEHKEINPVKIAKEEPVSTFSIDVDTASYSFVRRSINEGKLPQSDAVRVEELINYFDYDYEVPKSKSEPFKPTVTVMPTPWNKDTKLVHIGIKGYDIKPSKRPRANLVFLVDVSGSMDSPDKLPLLVSSLKLLVGELSGDDTVSLAVYAGAAGVVLEPTKVSEKRKILAALDRLSAGGSTAGGAGLKLAYSLAEENFDKKAVNRVILATDGDFNVGITDSEELKSFIEHKRETGIYLSVLGFGQGNYNDELMQKLAHYGNGNAAYIDTIDEARKVLVDESVSTLFTIANDVKIQVEFNPKRVAEYRLIGYETRMLNREDFRNDKVDAGDIGSGHAVTALYEITPVGSKAALVEPLRYGNDKYEEKESGDTGEYAYLRIRYKLPGEKTGREIERAINQDDEFRSVEEAPVDSRFAASVAVFGELLKGGRYTGDFTFGDIEKLARSSKGEDAFGYRGEFIKLIGLGKRL